MAAYHRVYDSVTCRLTAKNWDQLQNPTLGNRVWAACTFFRAVVSDLSPRYSTLLKFYISINMFN